MNPDLQSGQKPVGDTGRGVGTVGAHERGVVPSSAADYSESTSSLG